MDTKTLLENACQNEDKQLALIRESVDNLSEVLKLWVDTMGFYGVQFRYIFEQLPIVVNGLFDSDELVLCRAYITHITLTDDAEIEDMSVGDDNGDTYYMTPQEIFDDTDTIIDFNKLSKIILQKIEDNLLLNEMKEKMMKIIPTERDLA